MNISVSDENFKALSKLSEKRLQEYNLAIEYEDELAVVIRTHILIERIMTDILLLTLPKFKKDFAERKDDKSFSTILKWLWLVDVCDEQLLIATKTLNQIRNNFAHREPPYYDDKELITIINALVSYDTIPRSKAKDIQKSSFKDQLRVSIGLIFGAWSSMSFAIGAGVDGKELAKARKRQVNRSTSVKVLGIEPSSADAK